MDTSVQGDLMVDRTHFDVIVIGTGAGGGTLAHRLAGTGKQILMLERGDYLPRERDNWSSTAVFVQGKYRAPEFWLDRHGEEFPPEVNYYVGGTRSSMAPRCSGSVPRISGSFATTGGCHPPGRSRTTTSSPTTRRLNTCTSSMVTTVRTQP